MVPVWSFLSTSFNLFAFLMCGPQCLKITKNVSFYNILNLEVQYDWKFNYLFQSQCCKMSLSGYFPNTLMVCWKKLTQERVDGINQNLFVQVIIIFKVKGGGFFLMFILYTICLQGYQCRALSWVRTWWDSPCVFGMQSGYYDSGERTTFKTSSTYSAQIARPSSHRSIEWGTASHRQTETTQVT